MRRPLNWFVVFISLAFLLAGQVLSNRGGSGSSGGMLPAAERQAVLDAALRATMRSRRAVGMPAGTVALPSVEVAELDPAH